MTVEGLTYNNTRPPPQRRPQYGEVHLPREPHDDAEKQPLDRQTHLTMALAIFTPVAAAYGAIAFGLYHAAEAVL